VRIDQFISGAVAVRLGGALVLFDEEGRVLDANEAAHECYGYARSQMAGLRLSDIAGVRDASGALRHAAEQGGAVRAEHRRSDGTPFAVEVRVVEVGHDGVSALLAQVRDISEFVHAEQALRTAIDIAEWEREHEELRESRRWLSESQRVARLGHYFADMESGRWDGSESFHDVMGTTGTEVRSLASYLDLVHPRDRDRVAHHFGHPAAHAHTSFDAEYRVVRPSDGVELWVHGVGNVEYRDGTAPVAIFGIVQDITERKRLQAKMQRMVTAVIDVVDNVSQMRDPYTAGHQRRVARLAAAIARDMGMSETEIADIHVAALMHDIGKMSVPAEIPSKPTSLSTVELNLIKGHVEAGYSIIASAQMHHPIAELVYQHHERCDGSGYPRGLSSDELLDGSKVLMVADVVEAMMSHRPYRAALGEEAALAEIEQGIGRLYDPAVARSCLRIFREHRFSLTDI